MNLSLLLYQDDALSLTTSRDGAVDSSNRLHQVMKSRGLDANKDKLVLIPIASKCAGLQIIEDLKINPVK